MAASLDQEDLLVVRGCPGLTPEQAAALMQAAGDRLAWTGLADA